MALDSRDKRASALREGLLPVPDGAAFNQGDRQQVLWQYRGIAAAATFAGGEIFFRMIIGITNLGSGGGTVGNGPGGGS